MNQDMGNMDYAEFREVQPTDKNMAALDALLKAAREKEREVAELALQLEKAQEGLRDLTWRQIPELMDSLGLAEFRNTDGLKIEVREEIEAAIPKDQRAVAYDWLDANGHSGLLKRNVVVSFNRDQESQAKSLMLELSQKFAAVVEDKSVHPSTLKAWVRQMLAAGKALPVDLFGIFRRRVAKIHEAKK